MTAKAPLVYDVTVASLLAAEVEAAEAEADELPEDEAVAEAVEGAADEV